jgi:hypothetical protein
MSLGASNRTGTVDLPEIKAKPDKWDVTKRNADDEQDLLAIVGTLGRNPIVMGFIFPQLNQMLFEDGKLRLYRHQSDVMTTIDGDGNFQYDHPGGAFIRIAEDPDHATFTKKNVDKSLATNRNSNRKVHVRIELAEQMVQLTLTPDGDASLKIKRNLLIEAEGKADIKVTGNMTAEVGGNMSATIAGTTTVQSEGTATINSDGDVLVNATNIKLNNGAGVVTGAHICQYTGSPHSDCSSTVFAEK